MLKFEDQEEKLLKLALSAMKNAHVIFSPRIKVGAAVLTRAGKPFTGCNIQSRISGLGICAERCAIDCAIVHSGSDMKVRKIAVVMESKKVVEPRSCGACLEYITQFRDNEVEIVMAKAEDEKLLRNTIEVLTIDDMLPYPFKMQSTQKNSTQKKLNETRKRLMDVASDIVMSIPCQYNDRWCFIAGFSFLLHGVRKITSDIDILVKDKETSDEIVRVLVGLNFQSKKKEVEKGFETLFHDGYSISVDVLVNCIQDFMIPERLWKSLFQVPHCGLKFPTPSLVDMIILKAVTYHLRNQDDPKKVGDLKDGIALRLRKGLSIFDIISQAEILNHNNYGLRDKVENFLLH
jgi:cytidine deaminase